MNTHTRTTRNTVLEQIGSGRSGESTIDANDNARLVILWSTYKVPSQTPDTSGRTWTTLVKDDFNNLIDGDMFSVQGRDADINKFRDILDFNALDSTSKLSVTVLSDTEAGSMNSGETDNHVAGPAPAGAGH